MQIGEKAPGINPPKRNPFLLSDNTKTALILTVALAAIALGLLGHFQIIPGLGPVAQWTMVSIGSIVVLALAASLCFRGSASKVSPPTSSSTPPAPHGSYSLGAADLPHARESMAPDPVPAPSSAPPRRVDYGQSLFAQAVLRDAFLQQMHAAGAFDAPPVQPPPPRSGVHIEVLPDDHPAERQPPSSPSVSLPPLFSKGILKQCLEKFETGEQGVRVEPAENIIKPGNLSKVEIEALVIKKTGWIASCHVGAGNLVNFDIIAELNSEFAILIDPRAQNKALLNHILGLLCKAESREEFISQFTEDFQVINLEPELRRPESWLSSAVRFNHVKRLAREGKIVTAHGNLADDALAKKITGLCTADNGCEIHSVYSEGEVSSHLKKK